MSSSSLHRLFTTRLLPRLPPKPPPSQQQPPPSLLSTISSVIRFGSAAYLIQVYVCNTTMSIGPSMQPTLNPRGDILFTEYLTPRFLPLRSGDVVVATKPTNSKISILKRIRGMPGETIWVHPNDRATPVQIKLPENHVWLEGDNSTQSTDSRHYGPVPLALIRGRARARLWPIGEACLLRSTVIDHTLAERKQGGSPCTM